MTVGPEKGEIKFGEEIELANKALEAAEKPIEALSLFWEHAVMRDWMAALGGGFVGMALGFWLVLTDTLSKLVMDHVAGVSLASVAIGSGCLLAWARGVKQFAEEIKRSQSNHLEANTQRLFRAAWPDDRIGNALCFNAWAHSMPADDSNWTILIHLTPLLGFPSASVAQIQSIEVRTTNNQKAIAEKQFTDSISVSGGVNSEMHLSMTAGPSGVAALRADAGAGKAVNVQCIIKGFVSVRGLQPIVFQRIVSHCCLELPT